MTPDEVLDTLRAKIKATVPRLATHELDALVEGFGPMVGTVVPNVRDLESVIDRSTDEWVRNRKHLDRDRHIARDVHGYLLTLAGWRKES